MTESLIDEFQKEASLVKLKGALEEGYFEELDMNDDIDIYRVTINKKIVLVFTEHHFTEGAIQAMDNLKSKLDSSWCLLLEGKGLVDEFKINFPEAKIIELPSLIEGIANLLKNNEIGDEQAILATGIERLAEIIHYLNYSDEELREGGALALLKAKQDDFLDDFIFKGVTAIIIKAFFPVLKIQMNPKDIESILRNVFKDRNSFAMVLQKINLIRKKGLDRSNKLQAKIVQEALVLNYEKYAINIGKWHLPSLMSKKGRLEHSQNLYQEAELKVDDFINLFSVLKI